MLQISILTYFSEIKSIFRIFFLEKYDQLENLDETKILLNKSE